MRVFIDFFTYFFTNNYFPKQRMFILDNDREKINNYKRDILNKNSNILIDSYTKIEQLFYKVNNHKKNYYSIGMISENIKENKYNIVAELLNLIDPNIKILKYNDSYFNHDDEMIKNEQIFI